MNIDSLKEIFIQNKPFTTVDAANILQVSKEKASKMLYRYEHQGHLLKLKKGVYLPVSHKGLSPTETFSNPWVVAPIMYPNSYIGGWSAASHYGLTEQLFQKTCLIIPKQVHNKITKIGRFEYRLFSDFMKDQNIGKTTLWIDQVKVQISDVHRTIIDMIENPKCGAGIQHSIDCIKVYFQESYNEAIFISYAQKVKNGVFFKRLGYITEMLYGIDHPLCKLAKENITSGDSSIDSSIKCNKLITRWNLYVSSGIVI